MKSEGGTIDERRGGVVDEKRARGEGCWRGMGRGTARFRALLERP